MGYQRADINTHGVLPGVVDKAMNDNFRTLFFKVFGNVDFADISEDMLDQLFTYPLQPQGEGNLDSSHPLYVRFFIPANAKIKTAKLNAITSKYRMDSGITASGGGSTSTSSSGGGTTTTSNLSSGLSNTFVNAWRGEPTSVPDPDGMGVYAVPVNNSTVDMWFFSHCHDIDHKHTINIPSHSHSVNIPSHSHDLTQGILESNVSPNNVTLYVNDTAVGDVMNGSDVSQHDIDIANTLKSGDWNIIKVTAQNVARITLFGLIEIIVR